MANAVEQIELVLTNLAGELGVYEDTEEYRAAIAQTAKHAARQLGAFEIPAKPRRAVLTVAKVKEMKELYAEGQGGVTQAELVEKFGVTASTVSRILSGKMWGHVS